MKLVIKEHQSYERVQVIMSISEQDAKNISQKNLDWLLLLISRPNTRMVVDARTSYRRPRHELLSCR